MLQSPYKAQARPLACPATLRVPLCPLQYPLRQDQLCNPDVIKFPFYRRLQGVPSLSPARARPLARCFLPPPPPHACAPSIIALLPSSSVFAFLHHALSPPSCFSRAIYPPIDYILQHRLFVPLHQQPSWAPRVLSDAITSLKGASVPSHSLYHFHIYAQFYLALLCSFHPLASTYPSFSISSLSSLSPASAFALPFLSIPLHPVSSPFPPSSTCLLSPSLSSPS